MSSKFDILDELMAHHSELIKAAGAAYRAAQAAYNADPTPENDAAADAAVAAAIAAHRAGSLAILSRRAGETADQKEKA